MRESNIDRRSRAAVLGVVGLLAALLSTTPASALTAATIPEIQGAGHVSPFVGQTVTTTGVVTAVAFNGYYVQDPVGDGDEATADGIFVFSGSSTKPAVGDLLELTDTVSEFIPGGASTGNLSTTQLSFPSTTLLSSGNPLPAPVIIGSSGRVPPAVDVISAAERPVNLQFEPGVFNPDSDGIDFFESLEGMLVKVDDPAAVSATRTFSAFSSEFFTLADNGAGIAPADARTARGGINLQPHPDNDGDQNPERVQIQLDATLFGGPVPAVSVGDQLGDITGVVGYSFGNFEVNALAPFSVSPGAPATETTALTGTRDELTVASYNVLNLSPQAADDAQRSTLAAHIADNLGAPDVIALQEIQDNSGETDDGVTDATQTLQALVDAVAAAGGPSYEFFDVAPADNTGGGVPGGNIRNAFLYNPHRVGLVDFASLTPAALGQLGVGNPNAFDGTRDPLVATFKFRGKEVTVINNHLTSRFGSTPVFGGPQPFVQAGEAEREAQMATLNEVVDALLAGGGGHPVHASKSGRIIVLGDLNTMEFTDDLTDILPGPEGVLTNLIDTVGDDNVYTFNFEGNSQVLDHMLVTDNLADAAEFDIVHLNVDFPRVDATVGSDHEPLLGRFRVNGDAGPNFTLTVLHNNDGESELVNLGSGLEDFGGVARFATVVQREKQEALTSPGAGASGVVMVSSGDNFLAGPEFTASTNDGLFYDAVALDLIGYDAIDIGNHDFDFGPDVLEEFIRTYRLGGDEVYLSANLDFSGEPGLQALVDEGKIASSTIVHERGERIGIVGATTANLPFISSPRNVIVDPDIVGAVQAEIDLLEAAGVNKVIFISHLQDVGGDIALLAQLDGVDIAVAGGGDELLANPGDLLVPGDEGDVFGPYPLMATDSDGTQVPVVTTSGQYGYLGKLVVEFDGDGNLVRIDDSSGPIRIAGGAEPDAVAADGRVERLVTQPVGDFVGSLADQIIGNSEVALDGTRSNIRSVATNEGNLIADALLWQAQQLAAEFGVPAADISFQNGGGIRNDSVIPAGPISELDTFSMVPFPNFLTVTTLSRDRVKEILEHAVSCAVAGDPGYGGASSCGSGRFAQVGGLSFVWDSSGTQQQLDADGNVTQAGSRVVSASLADGTPVIVGGVVVAGSDLTVATIDFLARGGDQYPYRDAPFSVLGASYQQALSNYIQSALGGAITAADYPEGGGGRIVRL